MTGYDGPRIGDLAIPHGPLVRIVELAARTGVAGAVVRDNDGVEVWMPVAWLIAVRLDTQPEEKHQ